MARDQDRAAGPGEGRFRQQAQEAGGRGTKDSGNGAGAGCLAGRIPASLERFLNLYHQGHYFASHEVLEETWRRCRSDFYRGLIILAAAFVRRERGTPRGVRRNLLKARRYLERYRPHYLGIDVDRIVDFIDRNAARIAAAGHPKGEALRRLVPELSLPVHAAWVRGDEPEWQADAAEQGPAGGQEGR